MNCCDVILPLVRPSNRRRLLEWKDSILRIVIDILGLYNTPYYYQSAFSFLQPKSIDLKNPTTIDLFIPDWRLFIDVIGQDYDTDWNTAKFFVSRNTWQSNLDSIILKRNHIETYRRPYLTITHHQSNSPTYVADQLSRLSGRNLVAV